MSPKKKLTKKIYSIEICKNFFLHIYTSVCTLTFHVHLQALMAGLGLQLKNFEQVSQLLDLPLESVLGQFNRATRRMLKIMSSLQETALTKHLPKTSKMLADFVPVSISLDQDLEDAAEVS